MPAAIRTVTALIASDQMQEAFDQLHAWLRSKPGTVTEPDFIMFCRSPAAKKLYGWMAEGRYQRRDGEQTQG